jgi:hypothetical protein
MKKTGILILAVLTVSSVCWSQQGKVSSGTTTVATLEAKGSEVKARPEWQEPLRVDSTPSVNHDQQLTLLVGTAIRMKLETPISTDSNRSGDVFAGRVVEDVRLGDKVIVPVGAALQGHITQVSSPRRIKGKPSIQLHPESIVMPNGDRYVINASVVDTNKMNGTDVDQEGRITGRTRTGRDNLELGAGAGAGGVIGAIVGGVKGSFIGAGIGAGGAIVHWLSKHNSASLPAGSEIVLELNRPASFTPKMQ